MVNINTALFIVDMLNIYYKSQQYEFFNISLFWKLIEIFQGLQK